MITKIIASRAVSRGHPYPSNPRIPSLWKVSFLGSGLEDQSESRDYGRTVWDSDRPTPSNFIIHRPGSAAQTILNLFASLLTKSEEPQVGQTTGTLWES